MTKPNRDKRPESVLVLVYSKEGQVLLLERQQPEGYWQSVTGSLKWQESPLQAAQRELQEETGLNTEALSDRQQQYCFPIVSAWRPRYSPEVDHNIEHVFTLELDTPLDIRLNPEEHRRYCWLPLAAAIDKVDSWSNRHALEAWLSPKQDIAH